jgi:uncharacterized protein (UPF0276 family)
VEAAEVEVVEEAEVGVAEAAVAGVVEAAENLSMGNGLPTLGAGLGFREPFRAELFRHPEGVDFLEITADHYFDASPAKRRELDLLADHFTLVPHGLDLSLGSPSGPEPDYLEAFAVLVRRVDPPWWSEHIAFTRAGGIGIGHLTPLPYCREAIEVLARNVGAVRRRIDVPLILENITSAFDVPGAEMHEPEFLTAVLERTGCGWLCDVTNLYTNAVNRGRDPAEGLDRWPWDRVVQLHLAGGHWRDGHLVDSHSQAIAPEVWSLLDEVLSRSPVRGIIVERDEDLPPFQEVLDELAQARTMGRRHGLWD